MIVARGVGARGLMAVASLLGCCLLSGCPDIEKGGKSKACSKAYEQCQQANGVLGVCDVVECAAGQTAPCLVCRSQH
jgi:hypothetical protein